MAKLRSIFATGPVWKAAAAVHSRASGPRYIHPHAKLADSRYVPAADGGAPLPAWKRLDIVQEAITEKDRAQVPHAGGEITMDGYVDLLMKGEA